MSMHGNWRSIMTGTVLIFGLACAAPCRAACIPQGLATPAPQDPVVRVLAAQSACPKNAAEWVDALKRAGARMEPTMVNFVGFHNPDAGAFFIFEIVSSDSAAPSNLAILRGDLLFGHFTTTSGDRLVSQKSGLAIELIG